MRGAWNVVRGARESFAFTLIVLLVLILSIFIRLRLASMPLERDEGEYAVIAQGMLAGIPPFQEAYSVKFPGTAVAYAGIMKIFGQTDWGVRMGLLLVNLLTILLVFFVCRRMSQVECGVWSAECGMTEPEPLISTSVFRNPHSLFRTPHSIASFWAAAIYSIMSLGSSVLGLTANAEHFVILFAMLGFALLLHSFQPSAICVERLSPNLPPVPLAKEEALAGRNPAWSVEHGAWSALPAFMAGICFGLSICMKQQGLFFALFGFIWILSRIFSMNVRCWALSLNRSPIEPRTSNLDRSFVEPRASSVELPVFLVGIALPLLSMLIWLKSSGTYPAFYHWCFDYARHYGEIWSWRDGLHHFRLKFFPVLWEEWPFFILAAWGLLRSWQNNRRAFGFVSGLILTGFLATSPGLIFRPHYFLFILPGLSLAAGLGAFECGLIFGRRTSNVEHFALQPSAFSLKVFLLLLPFLLQFPLFFLDSPDEASRRLFAPNAFPEMRQIGIELRAASDQFRASNLDHPSSIIHHPLAILGSEPEIYFYARLPPGSPYLYMYPLLEPQPDAEEMQRDFMAQIEKNPPSTVLFLPWREFPASWLIYPHSPRKLLAWMPSFLEKNYVVEKEFQAGKNGEQRTLFLFRRK